jgi:tRNA uridine 5-carboxymethylaminomethyl modification enzyme
VQGFVAGVNAALKLLGRPPFILRRSDGYIGALIDDLVTKGTNEPYRMMTSRSEYRLLHRQDNADIRMSAFGRGIGLISEERHARVLAKYAAAETELQRLENTFLPPSGELAAYLQSVGTAEARSGVSLADLLRRPQVDYAALAPFDPARPALPRAVTQQVELSLKYEGYIKRQLKQVDEFARLENRLLPEDLDYAVVPGISAEARQKLSRLCPRSFGQARPNLRRQPGGYRRPDDFLQPRRGLRENELLRPRAYRRIIHKVAKRAPYHGMTGRIFRFG